MDFILRLKWVGKKKQKILKIILIFVYNSIYLNNTAYLQYRSYTHTHTYVNIAFALVCLRAGGVHGTPKPVVTKTRRDSGLSGARSLVVRIDYNSRNSIPTASIRRRQTWPTTLLPAFSSFSVLQRPTRLGDPAQSGTTIVSLALLPRSRTTIRFIVIFYVIRYLTTNYSTKPRSSG